MHLGQTIGRLRKQKGLTQTAFAELMGVNQSLVTRWERNVVQPRSKTLEKMAEVLDISLPELMGGDLTGVTSTLNQLHDEELTTLLSRVHKLNAQEINALKVFLGALLTRVEMEEMLSRRKSA